MRNIRFLRQLRAKWEEVWELRPVKLTFVIVGTCLGTGVYYQPIIKSIFFSKPTNLTDEQLGFFEKDNLYPIKVRKHREQEKEHAVLNSKMPPSS